MPQEWAPKIFEDAQLADFLSVPLFDHKYVGYSDIEIQKIKRIYDWMKAPVAEEQIKKQRYNFGKYFKAHDERRGTDFKKIFPEFADFYDYTQNIKL